MPEIPAIRSLLVYSEEQIIGDGYIQLPFVRSLRHRFPDAQITWMCYRGRSVYGSVLAGAVTGLIDELLEETGIGQRWQDALPWRAPLDRRRFDLVIDMQQHIRQTLAARNIRHGLFISATRRFLFSDRKPLSPFPKGRPIVEHYLSLLDLVRPEPDTTFVPPPLIGDRHRAAAARLLPDGNPRVGLVPGAGQKNKAWPLERYLDLGRHLAGRGIQPVFFPGPDERDWIPHIRDAVPGALLPEWERNDEFPDIRGPLLVTALGERLDAAVTNDCGTAHMLAAGNTPLVVLYGHTNPDKYRPATPHLVMLRATDHGSRDVRDIPADAVRRALDSLLEQRSIHA